MNSSALFCLAVSLSVSTSVGAFEFSPINAGSSTTVQAVDTSKPYEVLDEISAPSLVRGYIGFNQQVGSLYFDIAAKKRSKIRLEYDNDDLLFSRLASQNEIIIDSPGELVSVNFNVFSPVSGHIKIFNEKNQLLKTVTYVVLKEGRYRQSIRGAISNSKAATSEIETNNASLSYSVSKKTIHSSDPYWNLNATVNTDVDNTDERTVSVGFGYSW